ncbi:phage protein, HK97 gp10 family [Clostridium botulinum CFSAN001627]|uniref:Phage protein, HK97 gp10 family n=1 Tax=Clostridium botulinum CFSAN001627 TaxID=1232189 RepID=M1ZT80_CLOBO|nr:phage protein, HK97 gp10 family [Clostridium botulinum CFSAN001627]
MADGIEIEGMEEFTSMLENMNIDEADEKKQLD